MNAPRQEWDGKTPIYSETLDEWYFDKNDLDCGAYGFAEENGYLIDRTFDRGAVYDKMRLYLCKPHKLSHVEQDYWFDDLGEDGELPDAICDALASLNEAIDKGQMLMRHARGNLVRLLRLLEMINHERN